MADEMRHAAILPADDAAPESVATQFSHGLQDIRNALRFSTPQLRRLWLHRILQASDFAIERQHKIERA
ncbi:MAG: hypothetical protein JOY71_16420 [Acetobacteraceae bacterium]|nr:hypothetical protein [Acetobacteraceae bacterium]